jgi:hypothetical protein
MIHRKTRLKVIQLKGQILLIIHNVNQNVEKQLKLTEFERHKSDEKML